MIQTLLQAVYILHEKAFDEGFGPGFDWNFLIMYNLQIVVHLLLLLIQKNFTSLVSWIKKTSFKNAIQIVSIQLPSHIIFFKYAIDCVDTVDFFGIK